MDGIKRKVFEIIREMTEAKQAARKFPPWADLLELRPRIGGDCSEALHELIREGKIACHYNINGIPMFEIIKPQKQ